MSAAGLSLSPKRRSCSMLPIENESSSSSAAGRPRTMRCALWELLWAALLARLNHASPTGGQPQRSRSLSQLLESWRHSAPAQPWAATVRACRLHSPGAASHYLPGAAHPLSCVLDTRRICALFGKHTRRKNGASALCSPTLGSAAPSSVLPESLQHPCSMATATSSVKLGRAAALDRTGCRHANYRSAQDDGRRRMSRLGSSSSRQIAGMRSSNLYKIL